MAQAVDGQSVLDREETISGVTPPCPLCGSSRTLPAFDKSRTQYSRCADCTLLFARAQGNANFQHSIDDFEPAYRQYLDESSVDPSNLDDVTEWIEAYVSLENPSLLVLDAGAGSGQLDRRVRD